MENLKELSDAQLNSLYESLKEELVAVKLEVERRNPRSEVQYAHSCKDSAKYHQGKYKHWAKLVKHVDTTKTNGYAWEGDFLSIWKTHYVPEGSVVIEVCGEKMTALSAENGEMVTIGSASTLDQTDLIRQMAEIVNTYRRDEN